jgi:integrase/recombinase XerD
MTMPASMSPRLLAPLVRRFFLERLVQQRNASPATIATYRDAFRLFLRFVEHAAHRPPALLHIDDFSPSLVVAFLEHLEHTRKNRIRSRNARLAALRSFARFVASEEPVALPAIQRILAIPMKRHEKPVLGFLSRHEIQTVLDAPDPSTWSGRRDRALFVLLYNTGARISEALGVEIDDVRVDRAPAVVTLRGKGRKQRTVPLWPLTARILAAWLRTRDASAVPVFLNRRGERLSRSGAAQRLALAVERAAETCPSLRNRHLSLHTVRHSTAMHLLQSGTDTAVIALWLGHESPTTTHGYLEADLAMKERALARVEAPKGHRRRFHPSDEVLAFLDGL